MSSYSSDGSSASTPKKKVHFEEPPQKSVLKTRTRDKENDRGKNKNKRDACEYCSCSCSECASNTEQVSGQKQDRGETQQAQNCDNHYNRNKNNQSNRHLTGHSEQNQDQNNPGSYQNRTYSRNSYQTNIAAAHNLQARLSYLQQNMAPRTVQPCRAIVVLREDVIECPSDPRPNAFFDAQSGVMRVYHGTVYGNPYATLVPSPYSHVHIGSFAPPAARSGAANSVRPYCHGARRSSTSTRPTTNNNNWGNPQKERGLIPGSWPTENNEVTQDGSEWENDNSNVAFGSGWGNDESNNKSSSSWGGDNWLENNENSKSTPNNNNFSGNGSDGINNSWGSEGNEGSNDNQQNNQSRGDKSENQFNNNSSWGDNTNNNTSPDNNNKNDKNEDSWGQPKTAAPWADMSTAQSTQGNGNSNKNKNGPSNSWGCGNGNQQSNQSWGDNSNNQSNNNANGTWTSAGNSCSGDNNKNSTNDSWGRSENGANQNDDFSGW